VKSLVDLMTRLLHDVGDRCGVAVHRDVETLRWRVEHEGVSYVTITLAEYCRDLERALANGGAVPGLWRSFGTSKAGLPRFMEGFLHRVFDKKTGALLKDPSIDCIRSLRQVARFGVKVRLECSRARQRAALDGYLELDKTLTTSQVSHDQRCDSVDCADESPPTRWRTRLGHIYQRVAATVVKAMTLEDEDGNVPVRCVHGPGATGEGHTPNGKWALAEWHDRLEQAGFTWRLARFGAEKTLWGDFAVEAVPRYVDPSDEQPARVVLVPKTLKSPRVIAVEPCAMQFAQQGLAAVLRAAIAHCRYTSGRINFSDQRVNQEKALLGSKDGSYATIDLKDASDRVDLDLVDVTFREAPDKFRAFLWASRSTRAKLPDGREAQLRKFASMGSAMCFPVEALVFQLISISARIEARRLPVTPETVQLCSAGVYVYGDDICCPTDETPTICAALEAFGLKVSEHKTFWTGRFRESCGMDAYSGERVTPVYLRSLPPTDRADASGIVSTVSTVNQLEEAGYWRTAHALRRSVERLVGKLPIVPRKSPALGWWAFSEARPPKRTNRCLQRVETRCWVPVAVEQDDPIEGYDALAKCMRLAGFSWARLGDEFSVGRDHLDTTARPYALALKRRWVALD